MSHCTEVPHFVTEDRSCPDSAVRHIDFDPVLVSSCSTASPWRHCSHLAVQSVAESTAQKVWFHNLVAASVGCTMGLPNTLIEHSGHMAHHLVGMFARHPTGSVVDALRMTDGETAVAYTLDERRTEALTVLDGCTDG